MQIEEYSPNIEKLANHLASAMEKGKGFSR